MMYLDTSVLAAYYCPEAISDIVERAVLRSGTPAISRLVEVELYSAVARKRRERQLSDTDANRIVTQFRLHLDDGCYVVFPVETTHFEMARDWIGRFSKSLRTLDALHLALCFSSNAVLVTADVELAKAARHFGVRTEFLA